MVATNQSGYFSLLKLNESFSYLVILATYQVLNPVASGYHVRKIAQIWKLSTIKKFC